MLILVTCTSCTSPCVGKFPITCLLLLAPCIHYVSNVLTTASELFCPSTTVYIMHVTFIDHMCIHAIGCIGNCDDYNVSVELL